MAYEKRLCILKQLKKGFSADGGMLTGAVYAERFGTELTVTPRIAGLSPLKEGRYALAVWVGGVSFCLELRGNDPLRIPATPTLEKGFAVLLCFVRGEAEPVAFGTCGGAPCEHTELLGVFSRPHAAIVPPPDPFRDSAAAESVRDYDDEAIAEADYYPAPAHEDPAPAGECPPQADGAAVRENAADNAVHPFRIAGGGQAYYNQIAPKLRETMAKYPPDERLLNIFPQSEWVNTGSASLGVIYAEGRPRYLCVAMENEPPEEAKTASVFVPLSHFSDAEGVYVVFQDADTGEYVKVDSV